MSRKYRWNEGPGIWEADPAGKNKDGVTPMRRYRPSVVHVCEPLMGMPIQYKVRKPAEQESYRNEYDGNAPTAEDYENYFMGSFVNFPSLERAMKIYLEGLDLVIEFRERSELFTLAVYRRQITVTDIWIDDLFLETAESFDLGCEGWTDLAMRMPLDSRIRTACEERSRPSIRAAAE